MNKYDLIAKASSDLELLCNFLSGAKEDRLESARKIVSAAGGLRALLNNPQYWLTPVECEKIAALKELFTRFLGEQLNRSNALTSPELVESYLQAELRDLDYEVFGVIYMDNQNRVIRYEELFRGTIDSASVYPREVVKRALSIGCKAMILVHNHPSGVAEPSAADRHITERLQKALGLVDVRVLDHIIVGDGYCESFARRGYI